MQAAFLPAEALRRELAAGYLSRPVDEFDAGLCVPCKGTKSLCGKTRCPLMVRYYASMRTQPLIDRYDLDGSSPPTVFVGRYGYPRVLVGPMVPPVHGNTSIMDSPEEWIPRGTTMDQFVEYRASLVRGTYPIGIQDVEGGGRIVQQTREIAMATLPTDVGLRFTKKPRGRLVLDDEAQPVGPSAPVQHIETGTLKIDHRIERATGDTDLLASEAVTGLHQAGITVTRIQRAFSVGAFGVEDRRRFVPTRWAITAVDDTIGKTLLQRVKRYPFINDYRVYESWYFDNRFEIIMMPSSWRYELVEAWYPNTIWNPTGETVSIISAHEFHQGRTTYAEIGGCYYAARLAVAERLDAERRQAGVFILREAHPGYIMPVGVWNVRENVRQAMKQEPRRFSSLEEAMAHVSTRLAIGVRKWLRHSAILNDATFQRRIEHFGG